MSEIVTEAEHFAEEAASNPELLRFDTDRIVELVGYESGDDVGRELAVRDAASRALADLAAHDPASVAEYTTEVLAALREEREREFASVSTIAADFSEISARVCTNLLETLHETAGEELQPLASEATVELLVELGRDGVAETVVVHILREVARERPALLVRHTPYLHEKVGGDNTEQRFLAFGTLHSLVSSDGASAALSSVAPEITGSALATRNVSRREQTAAATVLIALARTDPEEIEDPTEDILGAAVEAPEGAANRLCYVVYGLVSEGERAIEPVVSMLRENAEEIPDEGLSHLLDACRDRADDRPDGFSTVLEQSFEYLDGDTEGLVSSAGRLLGEACIPDDLGRLEAHEEQVVDLLRSGEQMNQRVAAFLIVQSIQEDSGMFDSYRDQINNAISGIDEPLRNAVKSAVFSQVAGADSSPLYASNQSTRQVQDLHDELGQLQGPESSIPPIYEDEDRELDPLEETVAQVCSDAPVSNTDRVAFMFSAHCSRNPERIEARLDDLFTALPGMSPDVLNGVVGGFIVLCRREPRLTERLLWEAGETILRSDITDPRVQIGFFETVAMEETDVFDRFLMEHDDAVRESVRRSDQQNRMLLLLLLGRRTEEDPRVGLRFLPLFVDSIAPHENPPLTDAAVHNIADVSAAYPGIVAGYADEVVRGFAADDLMARRHTCEALSHVCEETDVDAAGLCEPYVEEIVALFDTDIEAIRGHAFALFGHVTETDPEIAEKHLGAVIGGIYDGRIGVQASAMRILWEAVESEREAILSEVASHLDRIFELLETEYPPLVVSSIGVLIFVALSDPPEFDPAETAQRVEGVLRDGDEPLTLPGETTEPATLEKFSAMLFGILEQIADDDPLTEWGRNLVDTQLEPEIKDELQELPELPDDAILNAATEQDVSTDPPERTAGGSVDSQPDELSTDKDPSPVEKLSDMEHDEAVRVVLRGVSDVESDDPDDIRKGLRFLGRFIQADRGDVVRPVVGKIVDALPRADRDGKALALILLDELGYHWLPYVAGELDSVDEVLRGSTDDTELASAVSCVFLLPRYGAKDALEALMGGLARAAPKLDSEEAVVKVLGLQSTVMDQDSADPDEHAAILTAGLHTAGAASTAAELLGPFLARFETVPDELLSAATACLDRPYEYEQSTLSDVLGFLSRAVQRRGEPVAANVDRIGYVLSDQFETTTEVDVRALVTAFRLSQEHPAAVSQIGAAVGNALTADDERMIEVAVGVFGSLASAGYPVVSGSVSDLLRCLDRDVREETRQEAARAIARHVTNGSDDEDREGDVVPHVDQLVACIESNNPQVASHLLLALGAVSESSPDAVGGHIDTVIDCLGPASDQRVPVALRPLKNVVTQDPKTVSDHLDTVIDATHRAEQATLVSDGILVVKRLMTHDPSMVAPWLDRLQELVGAVEEKQEWALGLLTKRVLVRVPEAVDGDRVAVVLDALDAASTDRYRQQAARGLMKAASDDTTPFEPRVEAIIETCELLADRTPGAANLLSGALAQVASSNPELLTEHFEDIGALAAALPAGSLDGCADVFTYLSSDRPELGSAVTEQFVTVLYDGREREVARLLTGLAAVAEVDPDAAEPHLEETVRRLADDAVEVRAAAGELLNTLASSRPAAVSRDADTLRDHLTDDPDVARPVTETFQTLVRSGTAQPQGEDIERLLTHTDDGRLAESRIRTVWTAARGNRQLVAAYEADLRDWSRRYRSTPGIVATSVLAELPRVCTPPDRGAKTSD